MTTTKPSSSVAFSCVFPDAVFNPSKEDINSVLPLLRKELEPLGRYLISRNTFYDLGDGRVVKVGSTVYEAQVMHFVRSYTRIPVPQVYMVFQHDGETHIVMELIDGIALREAVDYDADGSYSMDRGMVTDDDLLVIMRQLKQIIEELRELGRRFPPKRPFFGSWPNGPFRNGYARVAEPFKSVDEFHAFFLERLRPKWENDETYTDLKVVRKETQEHAPLLTHGDLAPRNILVKGGRIVGVVDWETFGWYPEFWEEMGVRNECIPWRTKKAIEAVFGKPSFVCETYRYVYTCLTYPV